MSGRVSQAMWAWARKHRLLITAPMVVGGVFVSWQGHTPKNPQLLRFPAVSAAEGPASSAKATPSSSATPTDRSKFPHLDPHSMNFPRSKWDENWDQRHFKKSTPEGKEGEESDKELAEKASATRHILLIRHGQYNLNGKSDQERILTQLGRTQAELTGARLADLKLPYTKIIRSSMSRAMETAGLISDKLTEVPVEKPDDLLREGAPIKPEPESSWHPDQDYFNDGARIEAAFRKYFHRAEPDQKEDSYEIVVCHANVIRYFVCRALQLPPEAWLRISLLHASVTWVTVRPNGRVSLACLGDGGHFPADKMTTF